MKHYLTRSPNGFGFDLFDMMDDFFAPISKARERQMSTDVKETETGYELSIDMPGFDKSELSLTLNDGYLTVSANKVEKDEDKSFLRRERKMSCSRTYYVGKDVTEDDVKAKYLNGTLTLDIPKAQPKEKTIKTITID